MRSLLFTLALVFAFSTVQAAQAPSAVVRPAPDFTFSGVAGKTQTLKGLRGQPVVLIMARNPKISEVKKQAKLLKAIYEQFANKQVIFAAAFTEESGLVPSDIPFVVVNNGSAVASAYGMQDTTKSGGSFLSGLWRKGGAAADFNIAIIGKDGNVEYQTSLVLPPERVRDIIQNSYSVQANTGR